MESDPGLDGRDRNLELARWVMGFCLLTFILPLLLILLLPPDQRADGVATLGSVPIIEYMAVGVGIGLGVNPLVSFLLTLLPCVGICMLVTGLVGYFVDRSERATRFLSKVQKKIDKYPKLKRYGVVSSMVFVIFTGVYIGPGISFILGWPKVRSIFFMALGIGLITMVIGLGTMGVLNLFFL
jgi:uncharacterized membrane protein